jgi:hypothetical protein
MKDSFYKDTEGVFNKVAKYHMNILLDFNANSGWLDTGLFRQFNHSKLI